MKRKEKTTGWKKSLRTIRNIRRIWDAILRNRKKLARLAKKLKKQISM
ncbi:MAG TPA: hypothetical protein H9858_08635 [Candidatus Blautia stercoravium]|nr:hypothetical protein [Candidatus Blautia stercoravium]